MLLEFQGTLLVVSHDRAFLDNVVTSTLVFEGNGEWREYVGGYEDWVRQSKAGVAALSAASAAGAAGAKSKAKDSASTAPRPRRAGFKEKRELGQLPAQIEKLEAERQALFDRMAAPDFYTRRGDEIAQAKARLAAIEGEIQVAFARWTELDTLVAGDGE